MPVQEFNESHSSQSDPHTGERLRNYWGYDPINFFAVKGSYASVSAAGGQVLEFKKMVRAFHAAGIEVILDVVFNHTVEGDELGPTVCFRGIDNAIYYWLKDGRFYRDFTGTGQTINASHPVVRDLDPRRPALLGDRNARRWLPLRPRLGPRPRSARPHPDGCSLTRANRRGSDPPRHQVDRRGLGCRRRLPGRQFLPRPLGRMERPFPR